MKNSLEILAETPPRIAFRSFRETSSRIQALETALGLPPAKPIFNIPKSNARIRELESMLAAKSAAAAPVVVAPAAPPASEAITLAGWRALSAADQTSFCRDGGKMQRDEFLNMPPAAQSFFLSCGGKLASDEKPDSPKTKNPPANSMWLKDFLKMEPKAQTAHFAAGRKVHD
jgi:hypothetical protein